ncbi:neutral alpha-glucosidase C-like [Sitophilus oryzae]|uniref:Glucosidase II subunit alpha n=1 Tax=Sitophilus oryzae TaxID=7048 RepID=A0A6J2XSM6_SITOR|nr:neutral alpha-glucosidase C-like [Sitophilus oryzae]
MLRYALAVVAGLFLASTVTVVVADRNLDIPFPFNCSTKTLCSDLRIKLPNENEEYNAVYLGLTDGALNFNLSNKAGNELILFLGGIENNRFRVIVEEPDRHRYKLEHSLEKEPTTTPLTVDSVEDSAVTASDGNGNKAIVRLTPLSIEFYHNDVLESVFEGNRIIFQNTEDNQDFTFSVRFVDADRLLGLHEHAADLALKHTVDLRTDPYRLRNTDYGTTRYDLNSTESMYGSVPVIYGFGANTSGIFVHNAAEMFIDIDNNRKSAYFMVNGGTLDVFFLLGPSLKESVRQYIDLTGKPHLPQIWALGYHQCRWAYNTTEDVKDTIGNFDKYEFPLDVLWLDIEYTSERRWFTWNATSFPDPVDLLNWVDSQGHRKLVPISDPHIKIDLNYSIYTDLLNNSYFVNSPNGSAFESECWPGETSWIDYLNPGARDYYANLHLYSNFPSTPALGGFWNDMNEPTLFDNLYERSLPYDTLHYGNVKHRDVHNIYGLLQTLSTHQGLIARDEGKLRPFILSRSYFAGSQRYANKWSGDNWGYFEDLRYSVPMALTSNLVGVAFYGADIPGFFGTATEELLIKWYQIGIWLPFFRAHAALGSPRREPFRFPNETQVILRETIGLRYKHLPYWYTLFYEHTRTGDPIVRPLLYEYPEDKTGYDLTDELLIGSDILAASVYESNATSVSVYFPGKDQSWYQVTGDSPVVFESGNFSDVPVDLTFTPVFYRSGSIITRKPNVQRSTADIKDDPNELHVVPDKNGNATGRVYIDDFESFNYVNEKQYLYANLDYDSASKSVKVTSIDSDSDSSNFTLSVQTVYLYNKKDDGTYSVDKIDQTKDGVPLVDIDLSTHSLLL